MFFMYTIITWVVLCSNAPYN